MRDLVKEAKYRPEKLREKKERLKYDEKKRVAINSAIKLMLSEGKAIDSSKKVCRVVMDTDNLDVN